MTCHLLNMWYNPSRRCLQIPCHRPLIQWYKTHCSKVLNPLLLFQTFLLFMIFLLLYVSLLDVQLHHHIWKIMLATNMTSPSSSPMIIVIICSKVLLLPLTPYPYPKTGERPCRTLSGKQQWSRKWKLWRKNRTWELVMLPMGKEPVGVHGQAKSWRQSGTVQRSPSSEGIYPNIWDWLWWDIRIGCKNELCKNSNSMCSKPWMGPIPTRCEECIFTWWSSRGNIYIYANYTGFEQCSN